MAIAEQPKKVRTRFAPSPTGYVHIGSLRTALFAFLFARCHGGTNILRIEDTDQSRFVAGAVENMISVLGGLGVEFDEGPYLTGNTLGQKGELGPYIQSERNARGIYRKHADRLLQEKKAYYCFCSETRLEEVRKEQVALKKPPMYDRHCRSLSEEEIQTRLSEFAAAGKNPVVRFAIPWEGQTVIHDAIYGDITYDNKVLDDQILLKSDGFPTYHLAVVVDDHLMEITHVIRGEEWIPSTPKHILLYRAFGWEPAQFAHLPLIVNPDKSKLSKRQGDVAVEDFLKKGYLPEALVNFVAFLGWNPKTEQEIFSLPELIGQFDLAKVNKSAAVLDVNKLDWMNSHYIRGKSPEELTSLLLPYWKEAGIDVDKFSHEYLAAIAALEQERLKKLSEIGERTRYFFAAPASDAALLTWKKSTPEHAKTILGELHDFLAGLADSEWGREAIETNIKRFIADRGYDNGSVLWPLRTALTGLDKSPGPFDVTAVLVLGLGKQEVLARLTAAAARL